MKKYELTNETKQVLEKTVHRIKYLGDIPRYWVKAGDLGGWLESERNLSQEGNCCVLGNGIVIDNGYVSGDGCVSGKGFVSGNGCVSGDGGVSDNGYVGGDGYIGGNGCVNDYGRVSANGVVNDNGCVNDHGRVSGNAKISSSNDIAVISGFGSENSTTTFYTTVDGNIGVTCGCFTGTLDEFRDKVREIHDNTDIAKEYLEIADLTEKRFKRLKRAGKSYNLNTLTF